VRTIARSLSSFTNKQEDEAFNHIVFALMHVAVSTTNADIFIFDRQPLYILISVFPHFNGRSVVARAYAENLAR
jgi:hypothetical protein